MQLGLSLMIRPQDRSDLIRVQAIFASGGYNGAIYDYSNISSLYQDSAGTTPVTAVTNPGGLSLDSRLGLALGPELVAKPTTDTTGWTSSPTYTSTKAIVGGKLQITAAVNYGYQYQAFTCVVGKTYVATVLARRVSGTGSAELVAMETVDGTAIALGQLITSSSLVSTQIVFTATATTHYIRIGEGNAVVGSVHEFDNISVKLLDGNHALQATAAARPTWSNRVNQLTSTENASSLDWSKVTATLVGGIPDPLGGTRAMTATATAAGGYVTLAGASSVGIPKVNQIWIRRRSGTGVVNIIDAGFSVWIPVTLTSNWQLFSSATSAGSNFAAGVQLMTNGDAVDISFPQCELGSTATRYQRVTTATDFDTVGFPYYLSFLGTDDSLTSATGGGGSAGFFWCGVVQPTGGAGTNMVLFDNRGTNTGYIVNLDTTNKLNLVAGNGAGFIALVSDDVVNIGTKYLLSVWDDGVNFNVQVNLNTIKSMARPAVVAGAAGFTVGKNNIAADSYLVGNLYSSVYFKDTGLTAAQRAAAQAWAMAKGGM